MTEEEGQTQERGKSGAVRKGAVRKRITKMREGVVLSAKMHKTAVVAVTRRILHPLYHKYVRRTKRFYVHDEGNECQAGDKVRIVETRPLSKLKRWRVKEILRRTE